MQIAFTLLVGSTGFLVAKQLKIPAPAMIGSMLVVGLFNVMFQTAYIPSFAKILTKGIAGAFIGAQMDFEDIKNIKRIFKPLAVLLGLFTINTFVVGHIMTWVSEIVIVTALLASVAGGLTDLSLISFDMGAETSTVALLQTSRLISTYLFLPFWIQFFSKKDGFDTKEVEPLVKTKKGSLADKRWSQFLFTLGVAFTAGYIGENINIPGGGLLLSMVVIMVLNNTTNLILTDFRVKIIGQLLAGSLVGTTMTRSTFLAIPKLVVPIMILLVSFWSINVYYGYLCRKYQFMDMKSALFASAPAGASDMALIASDLGADLTKIGLMQMLRLIYAVSLMPQLINLYKYLFM